MAELAFPFFNALILGSFLVLAGWDLATIKNRTKR